MLKAIVVFVRCGNRGIEVTEIAVGIRVKPNPMQSCSKIGSPWLILSHKVTDAPNIIFELNPDIKNSA